MAQNYGSWPGSWETLAQTLISQELKSVHRHVQLAEHRDEEVSKSLSANPDKDAGADYGDQADTGGSGEGI
jgi:hypothetical protein